MVTYWSYRSHENRNITNAQGGGGGWGTILRADDGGGKN